MSRTIRRKNIETQLGNLSKLQYNIAGPYTESDFVITFVSWVHIYREPTPKERFKRWKELHSDNQYRYQTTVSKENRRLEQKSHRAFVKEKIKNFLKDRSDNVITYKAERCQKWYW